MPNLRFLWPVALITLCLVALCAFTAISLFRQQVTITATLREAVASRRAAVELGECLLDLLALLKDRVESVAALHARARRHLQALGEYADEAEEQRILTRLDDAFAAYLARWEQMPRPGQPGHAQSLRDAASFLEETLVKDCKKFEQFNATRIADRTQEHERVLGRLAFGMATIGGLGGVAGLVLGYGVARGLSRSIRRLQVQIRDAAGMLGPDLPPIVLTEEGDFAGLHEQVERLTGGIEEVVRQLQEREHEVLRAEQLAAVGQLAAGVAHEIRNPLTSIKMLVQAGLEEEGTGGLAGEDLRIIEQEIRRLERSLQTFLDFARPPKPERRAVRAGEVVAACLGLIRGRADKQHVEVRLEAPAGDVTLTADSEQLRQVLVNLTLNALDAMPTGGTLTVRTQVRGREVVLEVADTGPGIAAEVMPRLFQPFVSGKETGLGLGLVISRRIVEDHGGAMRAENRPGGGARVVVSLPISPGGLRDARAAGGR